MFKRTSSCLLSVVILATMALTLSPWRLVYASSASFLAAHSEPVFSAARSEISASQNADASPALAHLRLAHLAPALGATDLYLNGIPIMRQLTAGEITDWREYPPATYILTTSSSSSARPLAQFDLRNDDWFTLALVDTEEGAMAQVVEEDYRPSILDPSAARLTVVHAPDDTVIVDALAGSEVVVQTEPVSDATATGIVDIPAGSHDLVIVNSADGATIGQETAGYDFPAMSNTFIAVYDVDDTPMTIVQTAMMPQMAEGPLALLRVLHVSSGTPPLDVFVDGRIQKTTGDGDTAELRFPEMSGWMILPAGETRIVLTESGNSRNQPIMPELTLDLTPDSTTTLTVIGAIANNTLEVWPLQEDFSDVTTGLVRVGLFNAHPGAGAVNVMLDDGNALASQLGFPGFFGDNDGFIETIVDEGTYAVEASSSSGEDALVEFPIELRSGRNYFLAIISANPPYFLTFSDLAETQALFDLLR